MIDIERALAALHEAGARFVVVGGVAAAAHGSTQGTVDLDLVYARDAENLGRVTRALAAHHPYPRGAPPGLPFLWDERTLAMGLNFTLATDLGWMDLLGEIAGGGRYEDLLPHTVEIELFGVRCLFLDLDMLIETKRAAGRPKDYQVVAELEVLRTEMAAGGTGGSEE